MNQETIGSNDKDVNKYLAYIFDVATELVYQEMREDPQLAKECVNITDAKICRNIQISRYYKIHNISEKKKSIQYLNI